MTGCYCRFILALLVIVFAWLDTGYNQIILTILGLVILVMSIKPDFCCCCGKQTTKKTKKK
jgi:hypothetical protein